MVLCGSVGIHEESPGQAASERVVGTEDSSILEMPVLWDDHLEYQHQWSAGNQSLEASYLYCRGQAAEVMQVLMGSQAQGNLGPGLQVCLHGTHWDSKTEPVLIDFLVKLDSYRLD